MNDSDQAISGRNGVSIKRSAQRASGQAQGYRTYEVYQRERVGESTPLIKPGALISDDFRRDPYPLLGILREHYPCYRNWQTNSYWLTRYNDVTSVFTDDANFESRAKTRDYHALAGARDLGQMLCVLTAEETLIDQFAPMVAEKLAHDLAVAGSGDLVTDFTAPFALQLLARLLDLPEAVETPFFSAYWRARLGCSWVPVRKTQGDQAVAELIKLFAPLVEARRGQPGEDLLSVLVNSRVPEGSQAVTVQDLVMTLLERDHDTLHGSLANLWQRLLTHPTADAQARAERRLLKLAYLETVRHATPIVSVARYTRHEVERFGKLLPAGALVVCSAAAANRDPRVFDEPDKFIVDRKDLCQREPRGQYRADGLASGLTFGLGPPSRHPAVPEDRPRSKYALNRGTVVAVSQILQQVIPDLRLQPNSQPRLTALSVGDMHTCWRLPVLC